MTHRHALYLLHCGWLDETDSAGEPLRVQVPVYLIISASGKRYLVDTGNPAALIDKRNCQPWYPANCEITPADDPIARLAELGLSPRDIDGIIATHFDFDHVGRYDAFGPHGTDVWVQRAQMGSALSNQNRYDRRLWNIPGLRWHLVDGDFEIEPGITLLRTDGHAYGHQSLLIERDGSCVILAVDAIKDAASIENRSFPDYHDVDATNRSIDRLLAIAQERQALMIYGHDPEQWRQLPHSPEQFVWP